MWDSRTAELKNSGSPDRTQMDIRTGSVRISISYPGEGRAEAELNIGGLIYAGL